LTIFAVWDIFYYVWLKVLLNWPATIMDWDILFLIPTTWASPVLAPVLVSLTMLIFAVVILQTDGRGIAIRTDLTDFCGFIIAAVILITGFCYSGKYISQDDYSKYYSWSTFAIGELIAAGLFVRCLIRSRNFSIC